jgi:hypothetical protein
MGKKSGQQPGLSGCHGQGGNQVELKGNHYSKGKGYRNKK